MAQEKKKVIQVVAIVVCLVLAGIITAAQFGLFSSKPDQKGEYWLKCEACGEGYSVSADELKKMYEQIRPDPMMMAGPPALICTKCGEEAANQAEKCPECDAIYIADWQAEDDIERDRCSECGYSKLEDYLSEESSEE